MLNLYPDLREYIFYGTAFEMEGERNPLHLLPLRRVRTRHPGPLYELNCLLHLKVSDVWRLDHRFRLADHLLETQVRLRSLRILMYLTTWNIILGVTYNISSVLELVFWKSLKRHKIWRINHFLFMSLVVLSMLIIIFDSSLISRSYL